MINLKGQTAPSNTRTHNFRRRYLTIIIVFVLSPTFDSILQHLWHHGMRPVTMKTLDFIVIFGHYLRPGILQNAFIHEVFWLLIYYIERYTFPHVSAHFLF